MAATTTTLELAARLAVFHRNVEIQTSECPGNTQGKQKPSSNGSKVQNSPGAHGVPSSKHAVCPGHVSSIFPIVERRQGARGARVERVL